MEKMMADSFQTEKEIFEFFSSNGILVSPDLIDFILKDNISKEVCESIFKNSSLDDCAVLNKDLFESIISNASIEVNWKEFEKALVAKEFDNNSSLYSAFLKYIKSLNSDSLSKNEENQDNDKGKDKNITDEIDSDSFSILINKNQQSNHQSEEELLRKNPDYNNFEILFNYEEINKKREVGDFVATLRNRYNFLKSLLLSRNNLSSAISIKRLLSSQQGNDSARVIGLIYDIRRSDNGNYMIELEDPTGKINVFVSHDNPALIEQCRYLVPDSVIGVEGNFSRRVFFASQIFLPSVPLNNRLKKSPDEAYALIISDIHAGSKQFLRDDFENFIAWIKGDKGTREFKRIASLVKYIFIVGDLVDGVGIYPGQEKDLEVSDISKQYEIIADYLSQIPKEKRIFVIPGNHDAVRLAEPQPVLPEKYAKPIYDLPNVTFLTNPSVVRIHKKQNFPGFDFLLYHGYSFDHYVANVDAIREEGGYDRADLIMKFLLDARHLAPTHSSTLFVPDPRDDFLLIKNVPDFFITGHIHKSSVSNYNATTMISGSCWQSITSFQEKFGHHPEPSKVPLINLKTRDVKILCFGKD